MAWHARCNGKFTDAYKEDDMSLLFGPTLSAVEGAMRFRQSRQSILSGNVANADTPGYRRFELSLDDALGGDGFARTDPRHLSASGTQDPRYRLLRGDYGSRPDRNGVELDHELLQLSRNAGAFEQQAEVLSRLLTLRRIAATGEAR